MTISGIPKTLQDRLRAGKVIPFIGAGVSMAVKKHDGERLFPSWKQLLLSAADRLEQEEKVKDAAAMRALLELDAPDYLYAAQQTRKVLGAAVWYEYLRNKIDFSRKEAADDSLALACAVWGLGSQLVLTTNYDRVLRWACHNQSDIQEWDIEATAEQAQLLRAGVPHPTVWHLHGHIGNKINLILTPDGYQRLYPDDSAERKHQAALKTLQHCLASYSFLFIGFSLDDEHFGAQLKAITDVYQGATGPHYALVKADQQAGFKKDHPEIQDVPFADFGEPLLRLVTTLGELAPTTIPPIDSKPKTPLGGTDGEASPPPDTPPLYSLDHPVFFVPFREKGDQVIGREGALEKVRQQLTAGRRTAIGQAASFHGLGGLGKTQLAVEYAYRYSDSYPNGVVWITADQDIESQLTKLSDEGNWLAPSSEPKQKQDAARHRLRNYSDCLVIFDNLEQMYAIEPYLPDPKANPHILVTSRIEFPEFPAIELDLLDDQQAYEMLVQEAGREPETESAEQAARNIAHELDGLPLALELAGAYLRRPATSWERYLELLQQNPRAVLKEKFLSSFTKHEADLYATLKISDVVFDEEPLLRDIVDLLTWSEAAPMNLPLMCTILERKSEAELMTALDLGTSLRLLIKSPKGESYALHRLVRYVRREEIPLEGQEHWVGKVCQRLGDWFQAIREDFSQLAAYEAQLDHLRAWQQHATQYANHHACRLLWLQAYPSYHRGRYREIKQLLEHAFDVFAESKGTDQELEAHLHCDLGFALCALEDYQSALKHQEQSLSIRQKLYGECHHNTARSLDNIGVTRAKLDNYYEALKYQEKALAIWRELYGEEHPDTARSLSNASLSYMEIEEPRKALDYAEQALAIQKKKLNEFHQDTISSILNVAAAKVTLGRISEAYNLLKTTLQMLPREHFLYVKVQQNFQSAATLLPGARKGNKTSDKNKQKKR